MSNNKLYVVPSKLFLQYHKDIKKYFDKMELFTSKLNLYEIEYMKYNKIDSCIYYIIADNVKLNDLINLINQLDEKNNFEKKEIFNTIYYINEKIIDSMTLRIWIANNDIKWKYNFLNTWCITSMNLLLL